MQHKFALVNARSLHRKKEDLEEFLITGGLVGCLVTETWLKDSEVMIEDSALESYSIISVPRKALMWGGGLALIFNPAKLSVKTEHTKNT